MNGKAAPSGRHQDTAATALLVNMPALFTNLHGDAMAFCPATGPMAGKTTRAWYGHVQRPRALDLARAAGAQHLGNQH